MSAGRVEPRSSYTAGAVMDMQATSGESRSVEIAYTQNPWSLAPLSLLNWGLTIVTLTLYRFWAKTEVRKRIWAAVEIDGEALSYLGKGSEKLVGFIIAMVGLLPIFGIIYGAQLFLPPLISVVIILPTYLVFFWLVYFGQFAALRYQLTRTLWRGVRFGQSGKATGFAWVSMGYFFLNMICFLWLTPLMDMAMARRLYGKITLGDRAMTWRAGDGQSETAGLYPRFALAWFSGVGIYIGGIVLMVVIIGVLIAAGNFPDRGAQLDLVTSFIIGIGIYGFAFLLLFAVLLAVLNYSLAVVRRSAQMLQLDGLRFDFVARFWPTMGLLVTNGLILLFSLGSLSAVTEARMMQFLARNLTVGGAYEPGAFFRGTQAVPQSGEGLADAFDIGAGVFN